MMDNYGRHINNMRISVTQRCNLDCFYCHHEGEYHSNGSMSQQEIEKIADIASRVGIEKVKITGGEPLLRDDIVEIVKTTSDHMEEVSMTTNGVLLERYASGLENAGLARVNISLDAFGPEAYQSITNRDLYSEVIKGVGSAIDAGLNPVKLNMVILKGVNQDLIPQAIDFASRAGAILQLIEFETNREEAKRPIFKKYHYDLKSVERGLEKRAVKIKQRPMHRRKKFILPSGNNGAAEVEVVRGMHNSEFCANCTRLRVTSSGELKPCLLKNDNLINILEPIRNGADDKTLVGLFKKAIIYKEPYWRS